MSLVTSKLGRYMVGLAASGGTLLLLAGTASAATLPAAAPADTTVITHNATDTVTDTVTTSVTTTTGAVSLIVTPPDSSNGGGSGTSAVKSTVAPSATPGSSTITGTTETSTDSAASSTSAANDVAPSAAAPVVTVPVVLAAAPVPIVSPSVLRQSEYTTVTMPQTPVTIASPDPVVPAAAKQPALPKTNGALLTSITDQLAGTIVPRLMAALSGISMPVVPVTGLLIYIAILLSLVSITYGLIVRRGGFIAAARGDLDSFTFATPSIPGYAVMQMTIVLFSGVRDQNKTNLICSNACEERR